MLQFTFDFDAAAPGESCQAVDITSALAPPETIVCVVPPAAPAAAAGLTPCPAWQGDLPSFAEALAFLDQCQHLSVTRRRDLRSALISTAKFLGQAPRDLKLDLKSLSQTQLAKSPKLCEYKLKARREMTSGLNRVAALMGLAERHRPGPNDRTPDWQALHQRLNNKYEGCTLSRLSQYCSNRAIPPAAVDTATLAQFSEHLAANAIKSEPGSYLSSIAALWNKLAQRCPDLGLQSIERPGLKPKLSLPLERFPESFRAEYEQLAAALATSDLGDLHDDLDLPALDRPYRPRIPLKPSTVKLRMDQVRYAASALVHAGIDPQEITGLADLFTPIERVKTVIRHLRQRGSDKRSSYVEGVIEALRHAARFCRVDSQTHAGLAELKKVVNHKYDGMVPKNRERLRAIIEPGTKAIILSLPKLLLEAAQKLSDQLEAAQLIRTGLAIELLTIAAPRIENLNLLRLDQSLRRTTNGKRRITHMVVDEADVKNGVPIERHLPAETADFLEHWLLRHRPHLAAAGNPWLFPGRGDKPLNRSIFRKWITRAIRDYAGVEVHPHLFRHFCAWMHLQHYPGDYEGVRRLLGHKRLETAIKSYIAFEQDSAAARFDQVVLKERQAAMRLAKQTLKPVRVSGRKTAKNQGRPS